MRRGGLNRGYDVVWAIDLSKSMARTAGGLGASKLKVSSGIIAMASSRILSRPGSRVGIVGFHDRAFPILPSTDNYRRVLDSLTLLRAVGEGSAGGDGIVESVKMLRGSGRERHVVMVSDGGFNTGIPIPLATIYALNMGVRLHFIIVGGQPGDVVKRSVEEAASRTGGRVYIVAGEGDDMKAAVGVARAAGGSQA
ncbi:hypothetical protein APE_0605.1 [Aeropyrum pernix K1]|uniref:VWFA domain-containing protein n=1 Tax=Aeropyrum pernix (strain ATCC 700893 / DSM 11879 / JCM 9820 / NBRC 100138 / K1) TaxID=272557 RepID=Q9YEH1_AERPE|nr:hypothetical protein APE_0605.1 [Aeropyrum pernix K1]